MPPSAAVDAVSEVADGATTPYAVVTEANAQIAMRDNANIRSERGSILLQGMGELDVG
jgi:hypothetical protein